VWCLLIVGVLVKTRRQTFFLYEFVPFYIQLNKDFFLNNVSAFILVKIKQICSKQSLILKNYCSNVVVCKTESSSDPVVFNLITCSVNLAFD
jgi:hypothetical protein